MDWQTISAIATAASVAAGLIYGFWRKVVPAIRKAMHFIDDMAGEPARPGKPAQPGLFDRLNAIEHELHPNSGLSLRDSVNRQEAQNAEIKTLLSEHMSTCPPQTTTINVNPGGSQ